MILVSKIIFLQANIQNVHEIDYHKQSFLLIKLYILQGCKLTLARTPEAGKFHRGRVGRLEIRARPASREYTHEKLLPHNVY